ncbi:metal-dependent hydrolase [Aliivibrio fischeri]|uniref:metal-dependent hydrolase n=1 Tax=Aliivibrio fischeri TaxID=668 RepID=UPI0012D94C01|nr:metal-dependent hydrolase [Aliivibrio fischeri]MUJ20498.1 metal-dependent hydrolase [Aliivibrio fischeri]
MNAKGHMCMATSCYIFTEQLSPTLPIYNSGAVDWLSGLLIAILGGLIVDLDHPDSLVGSKLKFLSIPISIIFGHRGMFHSLLAIIGICYLLVEYIEPTLNASIQPFLIPFIIGFISHLFADSLTPAGIYWFYPLKYRVRIAIAKDPLTQFMIYAPTLVYAVYLKVFELF